MRLSRFSKSGGVNLHWKSIALALLLMPASISLGQAGKTYPEVYGPTGRPFGPTQAEWNYRQQYGRPSPQSRNPNSIGMNYVNGYPGTGGGGYGGYGYGGYYGYGGPPLYYGLDTPIWMNPYAIQPTVIFPPSSATYGIYGTTPGYPDIMHRAIPAGPGQIMIGSGFQPTPFDLGAVNAPDQFNTNTVITPSTPEAQQQSVQLQAQGDEQLRQLNFLAASERYRRSLDAARDRVEPRYRLAITQAARSRFPEAVDLLKVAISIDPTWPQRAESLDELIGHNNTLEKIRVKQRVADWLQQDIRDPNRLFLMAALLYLDGDDRSKILLDTAIKLNGAEDYLTAFLSPRVARVVAPEVNGAAPGAVPPAPQNGNRGEVTGEAREKQVFEKKPESAGKKADPVEIPEPPKPDAELNGPVLPPLPE